MWSRVAILGRGYHYDACKKWLQTNYISQIDTRGAIHINPNIRELQDEIGYERRFFSYFKYEKYIHPDHLNLFTTDIEPTTEFAIVFYNNRVHDIDKLDMLHIPYVCAWPSHVIHSNSKDILKIGSNIYLPYSDEVDWMDFYAQLRIRIQPK